MLCTYIYACSAPVLIYMYVCYIRNRRSVDDPYSAANNLRINGNGNVGFGIRAPPWPVSTPNTKMLLLPKQLEPDDIISIECKIKEDKQKKYVPILLE